MSTTTLVVVVNGAAYENFAEHLFASGAEFFRPTKTVQFLMLQGRSGWPEATMYRHHELAKHMPNSTYVFLSDADMIFENHVGERILPQCGITATLHPGYVITTPEAMPYEDRPESAAHLHNHEKVNYYCGGFVGGTRQHMLNLSRNIAAIIDADAKNGITPRWHDESALNKILGWKPPELILTPSYCYPDHSAWYETFWPERYERKLVALDKTNETRGER